jgi:hypothetical protein
MTTIQDMIGMLSEATSLNTKSIKRLSDNDKKIIAYISRLERRILECPALGRSRRRRKPAALALIKRAERPCFAKSRHGLHRMHFGRKHLDHNAQTRNRLKRAKS